MCYCDYLLKIVNDKKFVKFVTFLTTPGHKKK